MPKIYQKKSVWLLCAMILSGQPGFAEQAATVTPQTGAGFTLEDAIAKALAQSPRLKGFAYGLAAARGEQDQAGAWENPEIGVEAENLAGTGA